MWKKASDVDLDVSPGNMTDWKGIQVKAGEVITKKAYIINEASAGLRTYVTLVKV
jgi:molybdopterin biosynthesis enzyme